MRPSEHEVTMEYARNAARRGTCSRLQVGAVIVVGGHLNVAGDAWVGGRLISSGYNGAAAGLDHCSHECDCGYPGTGGKFFEGVHMSNCAKDRPCRVSVHAEVNAIAFAARYGISTHKACMYVTHQPCLDCAKLIINAGIETVIFEHTYRDNAGVDLLQAANVGYARFDE